MIKEIVKYPNIPSVAFDAPVRIFNNEVKQLIQDLKDTIEHNNLEGLSAYQINNPYNVVVVKNEQNEFLVLINPSIYNSSGEVQSIEKTAYFGDVEAKIKRSKEVKVLYEDINQKTNYITAKGEFAILLQRKIDFTLGGTIRYRLNQDEQDSFDSRLQNGDKFVENTTCPTSFLKDKILNFTKYIIAFSFVSLLLVFFLNEQNDLILQSVQNYSMIFIFVLIVFYLLYGQYESKKNKGCSTCQIGHIYGNAGITFIKLIILFLLNYFIF